MLKPGGIFIAFCMTVIVASVAVILVVGLGLQLPLALGGGLAGVGLIALVNWLVQRTTGPRPANLRFFELEERIGMVAERVLALEPRVQRADAATQELARRSTAPLEKELAELGSLIRALAEQVETHEQALHDLPARQAAWAIASNGPLPDLHHAPEQHLPQVAHHGAAAAFGAVPMQAAPEPVGSGRFGVAGYDLPQPHPMAAPSTPSAPPSRSSLDPGRVNAIRRAIENEGIEIHLQPVAALPQRRVVQYVAVPYLREQDALLPPSDFVIDARLGGLQPVLDTFVLDRALRVARRLKARQRDVSLMVILEAETMSVSNFSTEIAKRLDANTDLATHLVIGFTQDAFYSFGTVEAEILAGLSERGFRFALTSVRDTDFDAAALHQLGVRFVRMPSDVLLDPDRSHSAAIHPADMPALLRRHGILLIAEQADNETRVADLLDIDVRAAIGTIFGPPRPVRPEIFNGDAAPAASLTPPPVLPDRPAAPRPFRSVARRA